MRKPIVWLAAAFALVAAGGVAWWLWPSHAPHREEASTSNTGRIIYYQDPSGAADYSPVPKKDAQGRDYIAVRAPGEAKPAEGRKVLYYRNPMGLADTSPMPKKPWIMPS